MENGRKGKEQGVLMPSGGIRKALLSVICLFVLSGCASPHGRKKEEVLFLRHLARQNLEMQVMKCEDMKKTIWDNYIEIKGRIADLK